jgi:hypothetical protein
MKDTGQVTRELDMLGYGVIGKGILFDDIRDSPDVIPSNDEIHAVILEMQRLGFVLDGWDDIMIRYFLGEGEDSYDGDKQMLWTMCYLASEEEVKIAEQAISNLHLPLKAKYVDRLVSVSREYMQGNPD